MLNTAMTATVGDTVRTQLFSSKLRFAASDALVKVAAQRDGLGGRPHVIVTAGGLSLYLPCDDPIAFVGFLEALRDAAKEARRCAGVASPS